MAQDSNLPAALTATSGFRPGTLPAQSAIHVRRAEQSKPTPASAHSLAARPGPCPVHSPRVPSPGFEPGPTGSEPAGSAVGLEGLGASDGVRTRGLDVGNVARYLLRHARSEPARRIELRLPPYQGGVLPLSLSRRVVRLTGLESNQRTRDPKSRCPCQQSTGHQSPPPVSNRDTWPYKGRAGADPEGRVRSEGFGPSRPRGHRPLKPARLPVPPRAHASP
jgi:hypothetical protein